MKPKKRNLSLWRLVQRWEFEQTKLRNQAATQGHPVIRLAVEGTAAIYGKCLQQLARALARLERKGKG